MSDQPNRTEQHPVFTAVVDRVIELTTGVESGLEGWNYSGPRQGPPGQLLSVKVDRVLEFTDRAEAPPVAHAGPLEEPPSGTTPASEIPQ